MLPAPLKLLGLFTLLVGLSLAAQNSQPRPGLQRSFSDSRLNRNHTNHLQRQSSFSGQGCRTNYKFDYVQLTLIWAPGSCSTSPQECKKSTNRHLTIHGMWPTIKGTQEPSNCCFDNTFDFSALKPILPDLDEYWFSYYDHGGSKGFWAHEWLKHGTCSRDVKQLKGEASYFGNTLQIAKQMAILEALARANIVPDEKRVYQSSDVYNALQGISKGKVFQISCDYEHHQPIPVITGFNFCFDSDLKPSDCPEMRQKCRRQLLFPASITRRS